MARPASRTAGRFLALSLLVCAAPGGADPRTTPASSDASPEATLVYVGSYTGAESRGIHLFRLQPQGTEVFQNVTLVPLGLAAETTNPSFLEIDVRRRLLFAVNEVNEFEGRPTGAVSAFSVDPATGRLTLLGQRPSLGKGPRHLALAREGRHLLVANSGSGSVAVLPVGADGRLGEPTAVARPAVPEDADPEKRPGAEAVTLDPANRFAFVCDPAMDRLVAYRFDAETGSLSPNVPAFTALEPGARPRRMVFRPDGRFAYVVGEGDSTVAVFAYDPLTGALTARQTVSTVPEYFDGVNRAAEAALHPSGRYLYVSNRGHDSVALFRVDPDAGTLAWVEEQGTGGRRPRHFGLEPSGRHLAIANLDSDTVLAARVDADNGRLKPSGIFAAVPSPACVGFLPPPEAGP